MLLVALLQFPIWYGSMPPLTDFGGHVQMVVGFVDSADPDSVWSTLVERRDNWWFPNMLLVRLSAGLYPALDAVTSMRLWVALSLVLTALGYLRLLETFGRSRWLIFIALPVLTWNGMVALGFVNYIPALACLPWAMVAARRIGRDESWRKRDLVALAVLPMLAMWLHGFGGLMVIAASGLTLVANLRSWPRVAAGAALVPAGLYWGLWFLASKPTGNPKTSKADFIEWLEILGHESLEVLSSSQDNRLLILLVAALVLAFVAGALQRREHRAPTQPPSRFLLRMWTWVGDHTLELAVLALLVVYRMLPRYVGDVVIADRVIPVLVALLCLLPRVRMVGRAAWLGRVAIGMGVVTTFLLSIYLGRAAVFLERDELGAALPLIDAIPMNSRAQCTGVRTQRPRFERLPLDHNCSGLIAARRHTFSGGGFADTAHNAIALKSEVAEHRIFDHVWSRRAELELVDWLLVRGPHGRPNTDWAELVDEVRGPDGEPRWTLYKSRVSSVPPAAFEAEAGGRGGRPYFSDCTKGQVVTGFTLNQRKEHSAFGGVGVRCRKLARDKAGELTVSGQTKTLSSHGTSGGSRKTLTCPRATPAIGLDVQADSLVRAVAIECAMPAKDGLGIPFVPWLGRARGGIVVDHDPERWVSMAEAPITRLRCPPDMMLTGIRGRAGTLVDALGARCTPLTDILTTEARPPKQPKQRLTTRER